MVEADTVDDTELGEVVLQTFLNIQHHHHQLVYRHAAVLQATDCRVITL